MGTPGSPQPDQGPITRTWNVLIGHPLIIALLITGIATAAITVTYLNDSTMTADQIQAPVQFQTGDDTGSTGDYVSAFSLSSDATYFTATVNGVPEANLTVGSFVKLANTDDSGHTVTISTSQVTHADVDTYNLVLLDDGGSAVDTLDLTAASPSASTTIPASTTYEARLHLELASGASLPDGGIDSAITLSVG